MNRNEQIDQLDQNAQIIQQMLANITAEQAAWQPDPETWSMTAVMAHMVREERGDFRARLAAGLGLPDPSHPQAEIPNAQNDLVVALQTFMDERDQSLKWLNDLQSPDWSSMCDIYGGQISAGDMLVSWVAHDVLHMRQLVELRYAYTAHRAQPFSVRYAGEW